MKQKGYYIFGDKGCEVKLRYEFKIYDSTLEINFYGVDLANLLDLTGHSTLKDMEFEVYMEVLRDNGRIEDQIILLPVIITNSTSSELRNNSSLYEKPYQISSNAHNFAYKVMQIRFIFSLEYHFHHTITLQLT